MVFCQEKKVSYDELLDSIITGKNILDSAPVYNQYSLLKNYLKKYRDIQKQRRLSGNKIHQKNL